MQVAISRNAAPLLYIASPPDGGDGVRVPVPRRLNLGCGRDIRAGYGRIEVLHGVSLTVPAGSVFALLGPNGAGKTTTFNLLTKFLQPTAGTILFNGQDITRERPADVARRGVIRSFQISAVFPNLTCLENVRLPAQLARTTR